MRPESNQEIANRLAEIRREQGLSQEELAERLGLSRQAISKWERGESQPDMGNLIALADVYGMTIDEMVCRGTSSGDGAEATAPTGDGDEPIEQPKSPEGADAPDGPSGSNVPDSAQVSVGASGFEADAAADAGTSAYPPPTGTPIDPYAGFDPYGDPDPYGSPQSYAAASAPMPQQPPRRRRNPMLLFPYPVLVAGIYLILGFVFGLWHPGWIIFFTIPFYYWAASVVGHDSNYEAFQAGFGDER